MKKLMAYGGWFVAGMMVMMAARPNAEPEHLVVRSLTVVDGKGQGRIKLHVHDDVAAVRLFSPWGKDRIGLAAKENCSLTFSPKNGSERLIGGDQSGIYFARHSNEQLQAMEIDHVIGDSPLPNLIPRDVMPITWSSQ